MSTVDAPAEPYCQRCGYRITDHRHAPSGPRCPSVTYERSRQSVSDDLPAAIASVARPTRVPLEHPLIFPMIVGVDDGGPARSVVTLFDADGKVIAECEPNAVTDQLVAEVGRLRRRVDQLEREAMTDPERPEEGP